MSKLTNTEIALLGLISEKPRYPYQIEQEVKYRDMRYWTELSMSSIYKLLKKFESLNLVSLNKTISGENRIQKQYTITEEGKQLLVEQITSILSNPEHIRWQFDIGIYNSGNIPKENIIAALSEYKTKLDSKITDYNALKEILTSMGCPPNHRAVASRPVYLFNAEKAWIDDYLTTLEKLPTTYDFIPFIKDSLEYLTSVKPNRRLGSPGNNQAVDYCSYVFENAGFNVDKTTFTCYDYEESEVTFKTDNQSFNIFPSPYSLSCTSSHNIVVCSTIEELREIKASGKFLFLHGDICAEQLMPKNFVFYNPDSHKEIFTLLEKIKPKAIIAATKKNEFAAAALDPFPFIEDGDFNIPVFYCDIETGKCILNNSNSQFHLAFTGKRIKTKSRNVIASLKGKENKKIIISSHIDAYGYSPGALDNATGVVSQMVLGQLLKNYSGKYCIEIIAFNGEDNYTVAGEMDYLKRYQNDLNNTVLAINIDDASYVNGKTAVSFYNVLDDLKQNIKENFIKDEFVEGEPWVQGDHSIFASFNIPTIAITTDNLTDVMANIAHTQNDTIDKVDFSKVLATAQFIYNLIHSL